MCHLFKEDMDIDFATQMQMAADISLQEYANSLQKDHGYISTESNEETGKNKERSKSNKSNKSNKRPTSPPTPFFFDEGLCVLSSPLMHKDKPRFPGPF